ncbi:MAG TPA: phospholipase [Pseudonocardiaceae bacterium]
MVSTVRMARAALLSITVVIGLLLGTGSASALTEAELRAVTDNYLFSQSLSQFTSTRAARPYSSQLDWSSDGCSFSPDEPFGWEFIRACHRHDFGYRNYKRQGRFNETTRLSIDNKFRSDMYGICGTNWFCKRAADTYYYAVRNFGASSVSTADAVRQAKASGGVYATTLTGVR